MFCTECGTENRVGAKFCMACGHPMDGAPSAPTTSGASPTPQTSRVPASPATSVPTPQEPVAPLNTPDQAAFYKQRSDRINKLTGVKGWLWFLCFCLGVLGPIFNLSAIINQWTAAIDGELIDFLPEYRAYLVTLSIMVVAVTITAMAITHQLYTVQAAAPRLARQYFWVSPFVIVIWNSFFWEAFGYGSMTDRLVSSVFSIEGLQLFSASFIWLPYLYLSKRVKYTYPDPNEHVRCPECRKFVHKYSVQCRHCGAKLAPTQS